MYVNIDTCYICHMVYIIYSIYIDVENITFVDNRQIKCVKSKYVYSVLKSTGAFRFLGINRFSYKIMQGFYVKYGGLMVGCGLQV